MGTKFGVEASSTVLFASPAVLGAVVTTPTFHIGAVIACDSGLRQHRSSFDSA